MAGVLLLRLGRRYLGGVQVDDVVAQQPAVGVVDGGLDHAVADGLGAHVLGGGGGRQLQLGGDVRHGDARVRQRDLAQARLQHVVAQALCMGGTSKIGQTEGKEAKKLQRQKSTYADLHEGVVLVGLEGRGVVRHDLVALLQRPQTHRQRGYFVGVMARVTAWGKPCDNVSGDGRGGR